MKVKSLVLTAIVLLLSCCTKGNPEEGGNGNTDVPENDALDLSEYVIVFSHEAEAEEGRDAAMAMKAAVKSKTGKELPIVSDEVQEKAREILVGPTSRKESVQWYSAVHDTFDWALFHSGGKIVAAAGGCWALDKAVDRMKSAPMKTTLSEKGNIFGKMLFPPEEGSNLRILDDNIWNYTKENAPAWEAVGADCTNKVRSRGFEAIICAYMPDVFTMQEYHKSMHDEYMSKILTDRGYAMSYTPGSQWNWTPVFYRTSTLTLKDSGYLRYDSSWSDSGSKSYQWAAFTHKATGKTFIVFSTHLWWKSESVQAGSDSARETQAKSIITKVAELEQKYACPVFVAGDMNCNLNSTALKQFTNAGYVTAWHAATVYGDKRNGHHQCSADGFSRSSTKPDDGMSAIDYIFAHNMGSSKVLTFWRIQPYFTVMLTDHYPNYTDIAL